MQAATGQEETVVNKEAVPGKAVYELDQDEEGISMKAGRSLTLSAVRRSALTPVTLWSASVHCTLYHYTRKVHIVQ